MRIARSCCALLIMAVAGSACHPRASAAAPSRPMPGPATVAARPPAPPPPPAAAATSVAPISEAELFRRKSLTDLNAEHPLVDAFFDYNQNILREDAKQALQRDAQWLRLWPQTSIRIDGHCDERGTPEYNLALGERRAEAVRDYLAGLGVPSDRIRTRSLGREAPFCRDSGDACWSQNRRGHFEITAK